MVDHLQRYAYYGFAAAMSLGLDRGTSILSSPTSCERNHPERGALPDRRARHRGNADGRAAGGLSSRHPLRSAERGRRAGPHPELKAKNVELVKIWVDDRQGTVPKLKVNVYEAIIDEAHKNGMRVVSHIFNLDDGKQLLKSGVDGFAHGVRNMDVDEEYMTILKQHPRVWVGPNLPGASMLPPRKRRPRSIG